MWLYHRVMSPNDADGMANSVDPDQTAPLGAVWSGSALFAQAYLSENLGSLRYKNWQKQQKLPNYFFRHVIVETRVGFRPTCQKRTDLLSKMISQESWNIWYGWQSHWKKKTLIFTFDDKIEYIILPMLILFLDMWQNTYGWMPSL